MSRLDVFLARFHVEVPPDKPAKVVVCCIIAPFDSNAFTSAFRPDIERGRESAREHRRPSDDSRAVIVPGGGASTVRGSVDIA